MRMREKGLTPGGLFADLLNDLREAVREAGSEARLVVWDDGLTPLHGGWMLSYNGPYYTYDAVDHMAGDFVVNVWNSGRAPSKQKQMCEYFLKRGFSVIGSPAETGSREGVIDWCLLLSTMKLEHPARVRGVFLTSWRDPNTVTFRWRRDLARFAWNAPPWIRADRDVLRLYDPDYKPTEVRLDGRPLEQRPARPLPDDWEIWKSGYVMQAELADSDGWTGVVDVTNEGGFRSRNRVHRTH